MKNLIITLLIILFCSAFFSPAVEASYQKNKIAVLDFRHQGGSFGNDDIGKIVAEWLIITFVREGRFEVIERKLLGELLEEQQMVEAGLVSQDTAAKIGKLLGVKVIISGTVAKIGDMVEVNARIVDVTSASIITAESVYSKDISTLRNLVQEMADKIMKHFPLKGYVAHRDNDEVVIDLGKEAGSKAGMQFLAFREGEVIKHPKTGEILYVSKIKTGTIKVVSVFEKISKGVITEEAELEKIASGDLITSVKNSEADGLSSKNTQLSTSAPQPQDEQGQTPDSGAYQAQTQEPEKPVEVKKDPVAGQLFVNVTPETAQVKILNIRPRYTPGIELGPGSYEVQVSAPGYQTSQNWYQLASGEIKHISIALEKLKAQPPGVVINPELNKYFDMLYANNSKQVREAAMQLHKKYQKNSQVITQVHDVLRSRFNEQPNDRYFIDAMAYLCNILGNSANTRDKNLLARISREAKNSKLKSYASKNFEKKGQIMTSSARSSQGSNTALLPSRPNDQLRVAIFPWKPRTSSWFGIILDKMVKKLKNLPGITLSYSHYKLHNEPDVTTIDSQLISNRSAAKLWRRSGPLLTLIPHVDKVVEIGRELDVDRVVMGKYYLQDSGVKTFMEGLYIYIINIADGSMKKFKDSSVATADLYMGDYSTIDETISKAFKEIK